MLGRQTSKYGSFFEDDISKMVKICVTIWSSEVMPTCSALQFKFCFGSMLLRHLTKVRPFKTQRATSQNVWRQWYIEKINVCCTWEIGKISFGTLVWEVSIMSAWSSMRYTFGKLVWMCDLPPSRAIQPGASIWYERESKSSLTVVCRIFIYRGSFIWCIRPNFVRCKKPVLLMTDLLS